MSTSEPKSQTAAERRSAEAELSSLIAKFASAHTPLIEATRRWLRKRLPTAHELVYEYKDCFVISYSPNQHGYEGVFALRASESGVKLYFNHGKGLTDPAKLLKGSGKQTRWIELESVSTLARSEVVDLMAEALSSNPLPFASTGRGSVIVRETTAKRKRGAE